MIEDGTPIRTTARVPAKRSAFRALAIATAVAVAATGIGPAAQPAQAQSAPRGLPIIRDTEIEQLMRDYASPILRAAGLAKQNVKVVVVNDRAFNAFVMDGRHIFINAGALFDAKTPNEIIGIFAHETGHLAGGHLSRLREQLATAQTASILAMLAGVGAMVAGARSGGGEIGAAAIMAPQAAIQRTLLAYVRTQEDQADHAGVKLLNATGQSPRGMVELFKRLSDQALFNSRYIDPYMQSHPMPAERVAALETQGKASPHWDRKDSAELQMRHDMMRAKLAGFLERPDSVARRYPATRSKSAGAVCAGDCHLPPLRPAPRGGANGRADPGATRQSVFPGAQGPGAAGRRPAGRSHRAAASGGIDVARRAADPDHAGAGADRHRQRQVRRRSRRHCCAPRSGASRNRRKPTPSLPSPTAAKAISAMPTSPPARPPSCAATFRPHASSAPRAKTRFPVGSPAWVRADDLVNLKPPTSATR